MQHVHHTSFSVLSPHSIVFLSTKHNRNNVADLSQFRSLHVGVSFVDYWVNGFQNTRHGWILGWFPQSGKVFVSFGRSRYIKSHKGDGAGRSRQCFHSWHRDLWDIFLMSSTRWNSIPQIANFLYACAEGGMMLNYKIWVLCGSFEAQCLILISRMRISEIKRIKILGKMGSWFGRETCRTKANPLCCEPNLQFRTILISCLFLTRRWPEMM